MAVLLIPATLTSILVGITEPLEFTFLFISPMLFLVHSILAATLSTVLFEVVGVAGNFGAGLLQFITQNWIFTIRNHTATVIFHILVGLIFTGIWFIVFRTLILKFNIMTPGRGQTESKLYSKKDYKDRKSSGQSSSFLDQAKGYLECLGGAENIESVTNCATRLRVVVKNTDLVKDADDFKEFGAHGLVRNGTSLQVIVGLSVPQVRTKFEELLRK